MIDKKGALFVLSVLGLFILPHSRMRVEIASTFNSYRDQRFVELTGIKPNIEVKF